MTRLCSTDEITPGQARRFDVDGHRIAVVRIGDRFYAIGDRCSHADVSLSEGEVHEDTCEIECWKHGSAFSLETGVPSTLPATRPVPVYDVVVDGGEVHVVIGTASGTTGAATTAAATTAAATTAVATTAAATTAVATTAVATTAGAARPGPGRSAEEAVR